MEEVEVAKKRCKVVIDRIEKLPASTNITPSSKLTLLRLAHSEHSFLSRFPCSTPLSVNIGHLEAVVHILHQPFITGVSRVCKPIPHLHVKTNHEINNDSSSFKGVYVDVVCTLNRNPVWIIVSDRNPNYINWHASHKRMGLKLRIQQVIAAARSSQSLKPSAIILFFSKGIGNFVHDKLRDKFGASELGLEFSFNLFGFSEEIEGEWINVLARSFNEACACEIKVDSVSISVAGVRGSFTRAAGPQLRQECAQVYSADAFTSLLSRMNSCSMSLKNEQSASTKYFGGEANLINFDTTALVALISGISNGCTVKLLATLESELRRLFKGNFEFMMGQVLSEIQNPMLVELGGVIPEKRGFVCEIVYTEFKELVSMYGGPNEKLRAKQLLECLM
ncbi:DUF1308 domain-containing protein, partial [Cephalotus follicularis]